MNSDPILTSLPPGKNYKNYALTFLTAANPELDSLRPCLKLPKHSPHSTSCPQFFLTKMPNSSWYATKTRVIYCSKLNKPNFVCYKRVPGNLWLMGFSTKLTIWTAIAPSPTSEGFTRNYYDKIPHSTHHLIKGFDTVWKSVLSKDGPTISPILHDLLQHNITLPSPITKSSLVPRPLHLDWLYWLSSHQ